MVHSGIFLKPQVQQGRPNLVGRREWYGVWVRLSYGRVQGAGGYGELDERSASLAERLLIRDQANLEHRLVGNAALFLRHVKNHRPSSGRPSCVSSRQAHL